MLSIQVTILLIRRWFSWKTHLLFADLKPDNIMAGLEDRSILKRTSALLMSSRTHFHRRFAMIRRLSFTKSIRPACEDRKNSRNSHHYWLWVCRLWSDSWCWLDLQFWHMEFGSDGTHFVWICRNWRLQLEKRSLFEAVDAPNAEYNEQIRLACITALLGLPPKDLLMRGRRTSMFYNSSGKKSLC
jgi:hypothetical protein